MLVYLFLHLALISYAKAKKDTLFQTWKICGSDLDYQGLFDEDHTGNLFTRYRVSVLH
jgi:hypothetical protein